MTRNILQRWMGLAKISLQTASGNSQAEMAIEGILQPEQLRDYLYGQMRGAKNEGSSIAAIDTAPSDHDSGTIAVTDQDLAIQALTEIKKALQTLVEQKRGSTKEESR